MFQPSTPIFSRAITDQVLLRGLTPSKPLEYYARQLRADAEQIRRDVASGRLKVTSYGYRTQAEIDGAVHIDGGIVWPAIGGAK